MAYGIFTYGEDVYGAFPPESPLPPPPPPPPPIGCEVYFGYYFTSFNGKGYIQDSLGNLYLLSKDIYEDDSLPIIVTGITPLIDGGSNSRKFWNVITLIGDRVDNSTCGISYTDDDYRTYSTPLTVDMSVEKPAVYSQGQSRRRAYKWTHSSNTPLRLVGIEADVTEGY